MSRSFTRIALALGVAGDIRPIVRSGDALPNGGLWAPTPDGLGGYTDRKGDIVLYATYVGAREGFPSRYSLTGEEQLGRVHDSMQLAIGRDGDVHELPSMGRFSHENATAVSYRDRVVVIGTDDTSGKSELYMYVADDEAGFLHGRGRLYVFISPAGAQGRRSSPDNVASGPWSLMVQEDPANASFAGQRAPQIWQFRYSGDGIRSGRPVAELTNPTCDDVAGTCWASGGIIDASQWFGPGAWLFDAQAHTLPCNAGDLHLANEGGQLLFMRVLGC